MASLYTPWMGRVGENIAGGIQNRRMGEQNRLFADAYMGDPMAMQNLSQVNPQLAMQAEKQLAERKRQAQQAEMQKKAAEQKQRDQFSEEAQALAAAIGKFGTLEEAKRYAEPRMATLAQRFPELAKEVGMDPILTEQDFQEAKTLGAKGRPDFTLAPEAIRFTGAGKVIARGAEKKPSGPLVTVDLRKTDPFTAAVSREFGKEFVEERKSAMDAVKSLESASEAKVLLEAGIISGTGATFILEFGKALKQVGLYDGEALANTEAYYANQASQVATIIKAFGAGTGLSDADREYAEKAAAGKISMTEESLRKIINLNERVSRRMVERFNKKALEVNKSGKIPFDLRVPMPVERKTDETGGGPGGQPRQFASEAEADAANLPKGEIVLIRDSTGRYRRAIIE